MPGENINQEFSLKNRNRRNKIRIILITQLL